MTAITLKAIREHEDHAVFLIPSPLTMGDGRFEKSLCGFYANQGELKMKIDSPRFGSLEVDSSKLIEFPAGLPGFEDCKQFTLIEIADRPQQLAVLQSADQPDLAFSVTTPDLLGLQYEFELSTEEESLLGNPRAEDVTVLLILRREAGDALQAGGAAVRANLTAPLVINGANRRGLQKVIARLGCEVTLRPLS